MFGGQLPHVRAHCEHSLPFVGFASLGAEKKHKSVAAQERWACGGGLSEFGLGVVCLPTTWRVRKRADSCCETKQAFLSETDGQTRTCKYFHLLKNILIFPCWFQRESDTAGNNFILSRGLKQMEEKWLQLFAVGLPPPSRAPVARSRRGTAPSPGETWRRWRMWCAATSAGLLGCGPPRRSFLFCVVVFCRALGASGNMTSHSLSFLDSDVESLFWIACHFSGKRLPFADSNICLFSPLCFRGNGFDYWTQFLMFFRDEKANGIWVWTNLLNRETLFLVWGT